MSQLIIPVQAAKEQQITVLLDGQKTGIRLYQNSYGLFCDIELNGSLVKSGQLCLDRVKLIRHEYLGFSGDIGFFDSLGTSDPEYSELGTRYKLIYQGAT